MISVMNAGEAYTFLDWDSNYWKAAGVFVRAAIFANSLHDFEFEVEFLAPADGRQVKLPKFPGEAKRRPALIQVDEKLQPHRPPEIRQTHVSRDRLQLGGGIERKRSSRRNEAGEGIAVEVIAMRRVGSPIGIRIVRRQDLQHSAGLRDAMQFVDEAEHVRDMLYDMAADDLVELIIIKRIRKDAEVVNDVGMTTRVRVDADSAGKLVLTTANVENTSGSRSGTIAVAHAD